MKIKLFWITPEFFICFVIWETLEPRLIISTVGLEDVAELKYSLKAKTTIPKTTHSTIKTQTDNLVLLVKLQK